MNVPAPILRLPAVLALLLALLSLAAPARAHTALVSSSPAEGATVAELTEVVLEFTEQLLDIGNEVAVVAPDGTATALEITEVTASVVAAVPAGAVAPGSNQVRFRVVSADGHPIEGTVSFTYAPTATSGLADAPSAGPAVAPTATPAATAGASPAAVEATAASGPTTGGAADAMEVADGLPGWGIALVGTGVVVVAAVAMVDRRRRRRGGP